MWAELKMAVNSTTGAGMQPLNELMDMQTAETAYMAAVMNSSFDPYNKQEGTFVLPSGTSEKVIPLPRVTILPSNYIMDGGNNSVKTFAFPPEIKELVAGSITGCPKVAELNMPCVERIRADAIKNMSGLQCVILGAKLKTIVGGAFSGNSALKDVFYRGTIVQWKRIIDNSQKLIGVFGQTVAVHCLDGDVSY